jgi:LacI family transcriptional regulator
VATLSDVAKLAGVSISAVSRVLSDAPGARVSQQTRDRIKEAASELNYRPNFAGRALKFSRTNVIALVVPDLTNAFVTELMLGVEDEARERDYMVLLGRTEDLKPGGEMISRLIGEGRVDGMLVQAADQSSEADIAELIEANYPIVFINSVQAGSRSGVVLQDEEGAKLATRHLIDLGHRRIGMVGGLPQSYTAQRRVAGFRAAMAEAQLPLPESMITRLGYYPENGRAALRQLMGQPHSADGAGPPTGVVIANINAAIGALSEARELGLRVPEDVSLVSVHDAWTAENTWPPLTTVKMPMYQLGRAAVTALAARLNGTSVQDHVVREPAPLLMRRLSTQPPPTQPPPTQPPPTDG